MTFNKLAWEAKARLEHNIIVFNSSLEDVVRAVEADLETPGNWRDIELSPDEAAGLLGFVSSKLQHLCMAWSSGAKSHDEVLYKQANEVLGAWQAVIEAAFGIKFEMRPVRSMVDEMIDTGFLEAVQDERGERLVRPSGSLRRSLKATEN